MKNILLLSFLLCTYNAFAQAGHYSMPDTVAPSYPSSYHASQGIVMSFGDTLLNVFDYDTSNYEVSNTCRVVKRFSYDGGVTWTPIQNVAANSVYTGSSTGGVMNGIVMIFYVVSDRSVSGPATAYYVYSTDKGATFSAPHMIADSFYDNYAFTFGSLIKADSGQYYQPFDGFKNKYSYYIQLLPVKDTNVIGKPITIFAGDSTKLLNEGAVLSFPHKGMIALARYNLQSSTAVHTYEQFKSADNGHTWTDEGETNIGVDTLTCTYFDVSPYMTISPADSEVIMIGTRRINVPSKRHYQDQEMVYISPWDSIYNNPMGWHFAHAIKRPWNTDTTTNIYGYPTGTWVNDSTLFCIMTDRKPLTGTHTLTNLFQFQIGYHPPLGVQLLNKLSNSIVAYPVPADKLLNINIAGLHDLATITITDANGRVCKRITGTAYNQISVANLPSGSYIIKVSGGGDSVTKPIVIAR